MVASSRPLPAPLRSCRWIAQIEGSPQATITASTFRGLGPLSTGHAFQVAQGADDLHLVKIAVEVLDGPFPPLARLDVPMTPRPLAAYLAEPRGSKRNSTPTVLAARVGKWSTPATSKPPKSANSRTTVFRSGRLPLAWASAKARSKGGSSSEKAQNSAPRECPAAVPPSVPRETAKKPSVSAAFLEWVSRQLSRRRTEYSAGVPVTVPASVPGVPAKGAVGIPR